MSIKIAWIIYSKDRPGLPPLAVCLTKKAAEKQLSEYRTVRIATDPVEIARAQRLTKKWGYNR